MLRCPAHLQLFQEQNAVVHAEHTIRLRMQMRRLDDELVAIL